MKRAVLFDLYDTLVRVDSRRVLASRADIAGACLVDVEGFQALWQGNYSGRMLGALGSLEDEILAMLRAMDVQPERRLLERLAEADRAAWIEAAALYPDAVSTLVGLKDRGFSLGLVSNCTCQARDVIRAHGLGPYLDVMALSFELGVAKPQAEIFLAACNQLQVPAKACVFVADGALGELEAAQSLGMLAVLVERPERNRRPGPGPRFDARITRLAELLDLAELSAPAAVPGENITPESATPPAVRPSWWP